MGQLVQNDSCAESEMVKIKVREQKKKGKSLPCMHLVRIDF